jgi:hypothetical protein
MIHRAIRKYLIQILIFLSASGTAVSQDLISVMPLGNSITRGSMCVNGSVYDCVLNADDVAIGYRSRLYDLLTGSGYSVDFVGANSNGYSIMDDADNSGFAGLHDNELADIMENGYTTTTVPPLYVTPGPYMNSFPAQLVLLHIGTNDVFQSDYDASSVDRILDAIDDFETASGLPVLVFVSRLISERNYPCGTHPGTVAYNNDLTSLVQNRINNGDHVVLINMECGAGINYSLDMADDVHPGQIGYDKMGEYWFHAIDNYNSKPAVTSIPGQVVDRGTAFSKISLDNYVSDAEDADADLTWSFLPASPVHYNISIDGTRKVTVTPKDPNWSGSEEIIFKVTDRGKVLPQLKKTNSIAVTFTVNWMPEIIGQQDVSTPEDTPIDLQVSDIIIVEPEKAPGGLQLLVTDGPDYSVSGTRVTPDANYFGNLSVPVRLSGGGHVSAVYSLTLVVTPVNDIPVITSQARDLETIQGNCLDVVYADLNVTDVDDSYPSGFTILIQPGEGYTYSGNRVCPDPPITGMLDVDLTVYDGSDQSAPFTVQVMVLSLIPEFILPEIREVDQDALYNQVISINHYNPGSFTYSLVDIPGWLSLDTGTGVLEGTPSNADVGENAVSLGVTNGTLTADTTFVITVHNINDPPVFLTTALKNAMTNEMYEFQVEVEDVDPDDVLTFEALEIPSWLEIDRLSGILSGLPVREDTGTATVRVRVSDGMVDVEKDFTLEVDFYNHPPHITTVPEDTIEVETSFVYGVLADDLENDPLTYFANHVPDWAEFFPESQVLIGTPTRRDAGTYLAIIGVTDGMDTTYQVFTVEVVFPAALGIEDNSLSHLINVYPNPVESQLFISINEPTLLEDDLYFSISDMAGRLVLERSLNDALTEIHLPVETMGGTYIYRIWPKGRSSIVKTGKIIVQ